MAQRLDGGTTPINAGSSSIAAGNPPPPTQHQKHHNQQNNQNNNGSSNPNNDFIQRQIINEIQRFESVHPCIYRIYDLVEKIDNNQVANLIRQQVVSIEDAFVNSQEWTLNRMINEIRLGVIGSEDSCKNSLVHYFLTRNWNWEDAPEGGRFKKEVMVDGRSYLLLIRDEGSREPNLQFSQWLDALLLVFTVDRRPSFQYALELQQFVNNFRSIEAGDVPIYLIGMKNMSNLGMQRMIGEEEAQKMVKVRKLCQYFECMDGSSVQRMFNNVCQRVVQQRNRGKNTAFCSSTPSSSFIGGFNRQTSCISEAGDHPMLNSVMGSSSANPSSNSNYAVAAIGHSPGRPSSYHHQRSISVLPINNDLIHCSSTNQSPAYHLPNRGNVRTPRFDQQQEFPQPKFQQNFRGGQQFSASSFVPNYSAIGNYHQMDGRIDERRRDSLIMDWQRRPIAGSSPSPSPFAIPSTPSCSAILLGGNCGSSRNGGNQQEIGCAEQLAGISPAYSHSSLSSSHYQLSTDGGATAMAAAPSYSRSSSNMLHHSHNQFGRPCSDPMSQSPGGQFFHQNQNEIFFNGQLGSMSGGGGGLHPLSTATSSSTLVVNNNGNGGSQANMLPTPGNTPKTERKTKRISNIFRKDPGPTSTSADDHHRLTKNSTEVNLMGIGRAIPIKQGQLYKRSKNGLNKEWKKKFVCLYPDGRICYHQNLKDYMDKDSRGKEIYLGLATVRTSDRHKQKGGNRLSLLPSIGKGEKQSNNEHHQFSEPTEDYLKSPTGGGGGELSEGISDSCGGETTGGGGTNGPNGFGNSNAQEKMALSTSGGKKEKNKEKKKRAKRTGSGAGKNDEEEESCEFEIITCDQKRWEFSAPSAEERDIWVGSIEHEIEKCLQQQLSLKDQQQLINGNRNGQMATPSSANHRSGDSAAEKRKANIQQIRQLDGNDRCADCGAPQPQWASINLGTLICIECSGIHRKLGSHISKVRSLELDDWPNEHLVVMHSIGNGMANQIWEHNAASKEKPTPDSGHAQKEQWIRRKYEEKLFLPPIPVDRTLAQQLMDAVLSRNVKHLLMVLPRCTKSDVNAPIGGQIDRRTAVHLACGIGAPEILQLLIWYNADIHSLDEQGRTALWHAQVNGALECAAILTQAGLKTNADQSTEHSSMMEANNRNSLANINIADNHLQHRL